MPTSTSIFADEWRDCLRAHFTTIIRNKDKITEKTLRGVMFEAGFTDAELKELTVRATMRAEDMDADFVPDLSVLEDEPVVVPGIAIAVPQEVIEAAVVEDSLALDEANALAETETVADLAESEIDESELETESESEDETKDDEPPADPDITQLSLF